jgi:hypothetical protein
LIDKTVSKHTAEAEQTERTCNLFDVYEGQNLEGKNRMP